MACPSQKLSLFSLDRSYRLVTRSDFDGLVCAALLKELGILDEILFVHPKDVQDGKVELSADDITTNLPYRSEVALSFDHHSSEQQRVTETAANRVIIGDADSAARVVYDHFGGASRFPTVSTEMMEAVDRADAAKLSIDDVRDPQGWILLELPDGPTDGPRTFPLVPDLQLPADDATHRQLPGAVNRRDPRFAGRG